jgi:hypothetical protein
MTSAIKAGSNLPVQIIDLQPEGVKGKVDASSPVGLSAASFSAVYLYRGNGQILLKLNHPQIHSGSRVVASASEYNTAWNVDRFIGAAFVQVKNVAPSNGYAYIWLDINWGSPINIAVTLFVEP